MTRTTALLTAGLGAALIALGGCTDPYGNTDYVRSGLLGAGIGAAGGIVGAGIHDGARGAPYYVPPGRWRGGGRGHHHHGYPPPVAGYGGGGWYAPHPGHYGRGW